MNCLLETWAHFCRNTLWETMRFDHCAGLILAGVLLGGCTVIPANPSVLTGGPAGALSEVMARKDRIIPVSRNEAGAPKPALLLLHGATDDPTEMMEIVRAWRGKYNVFLYSYNYHARVQTVAAHLLRELKKLRAEKRADANLTVVVFSYSAIVFRTAVIQANDPALFAGVSLVQLVPTAGGSSLAWILRFPVPLLLVSLASKPSFAECPYGWFAEKIWGAAGSKIFYAAIPPERMRSIVIEADYHSVAQFRSPTIQARYRNGIGPNVVTIPKSAGVVHDFFPTHPVGLEYLRQALATLPAPVASDNAGVSRDGSSRIAHSSPNPADESGRGVVQ